MPSPKKSSAHYRAVQEFLRTEALRVGDRLPGERDIAATLGIGRAALRGVLDQLQAEGIVRRQPQSGTFLAAVPIPPAVGARVVVIAPLQSVGGCPSPRETDWLYRVISSLERTAGQAGAEIILQDQSQRADAPCSIKEIVKETVNSGVSGAILLHPLGERGKIACALAILHDQGIHPLIVSARTYPGLASQVYFDSGWGAYLATRHLLRHGHTRIGFAGAASGHEWVQERLRGYRNALGAAEVLPRDAWEWLPGDGECGPTPEDGAAAFRRWQGLSTADRPTAIVAANDIVALGLRLAAQDAGITFPAHLSLAGFDNDPAALLAGLTTVERPTEALGEAAARTMLERLAAGPNADAVTLRLRPVLIERTTVGPPAKSTNF